MPLLVAAIDPGCQAKVYHGKSSFFFWEIHHVFNGKITIFDGKITMFNGKITMFNGTITIFNGKITILMGKSSFLI